MVLKQHFEPQNTKQKTAGSFFCLHFGANFVNLALLLMFCVLLLSTVASVLRVNCATYQTTTAAAMALQAADFEVYGRVQGVFFRKHTKEEADKLGLRGWCKNTSQGTVLGHVQGPAEKVETMMNWLQTKGSPSSKIEKAEFRNRKEIPDYTFKDFGIRKD